MNLREKINDIKKNSGVKNWITGVVTFLPWRQLVQILPVIKDIILRR